MRNALTIAALALTVTVSACAGGPQQQEFSRADADAIRKNAAELSAAFNDKNIDKVLGFYAENSVFMPPNAPMLRGRDPLKSFYGGMIDQGANSLELEPDEVAGHGPIAYESGTYRIAYANGGRDRGKYLLVLRNSGGTWRTEKTIWSSDLPAATGQANKTGSAQKTS